MSKKLNLNDLTNSFLKKIQENGKGVNTIKSYRTDLNSFLLFNEGTDKRPDINRINLKLIESYSDHLSKNNYSDNSFRRKFQTLRIFLDYLVDNNIISSNPAKKFPSSPKFVDIPRPTPFPEIKLTWRHLIKEEEKLNQNKFEDLLALRNQVIFLLIFGAGLKVSNFVNLKKNHLIIDGKNPRVMISHKKKDPYTIPLPAASAHIFSNYLLKLERAKKNFQLDFDDLLFNANPHKILSGGITPRGLERIMKELKNKLNISLITPKSLRQACIYKWLHQNEEISLIKEWMGVAPSYDLKIYQKDLDQNIYTDSFIQEGDFYRE